MSAPASPTASCTAVPPWCWPRPLGSSAGNLCVDTAKQVCVGLEINANHVRAVRSGTVTGTARALHVGRSTQLWEIRIEDEQGRLVCISRLTLAVVAAGHG